MNYSVVSTYTTDNVTYIKESYGSEKSSSFPISFLIRFIIAFLILINLYRIVAGFSAGDFTFSSFLEYLQNIPTSNIALDSIPNLFISDSWGVFDFLRTFINALTSVFGFAVFVCSYLIQLITFIGYTLGYFFS